MLVEAQDGKAMVGLRNSIEARGGRVGVVWFPSAVFGWVPPDKQVGLRAIPGVKAVVSGPIRPDDAPVKTSQAKHAVEFFNDVVSGEYFFNRPPAAAPAPLHLHNDGVPLPPSNSPSPSTVSVDVEQLIGFGIVNFLFPESTGQGASNPSLCNGMPDGNVFTWTPTDFNEIVNDATADSLALVNKAQYLGQWLQLWLNFYSPLDPPYRMNQPCEPILHRWNDYNLWLSPVLANLGFSSLTDFHQAWMTSWYADWVKTVVMVKNANQYLSYPAFQIPDAEGRYYSAVAPIGGEMCEMVADAHSAFLHELMHLFWACDEYWNACSDVSCTSSCQPAGPRPYALNGNCSRCSTPRDCLMLSSESGGNGSVCGHTANQIGWTYGTSCRAYVDTTSNRWLGEYWANTTSLSGPIALSRDEGYVYDPLNLDFSSSGPGCGVGPWGAYAARWTGSNVYFAPGGTYRFTLRMADGVRLYIDGQLALDAWQNQTTAVTYTVDHTFAQSPPYFHEIKVDHYRSQGAGTIEISW